NPLSKAGDQDAAANAMHGLVGKIPLLNRHAEIETKLEQQLVKDVCLAAVALQMHLVVEKRLLEVVPVRLPRMDVAGVELEDAKAGVAGKHRGRFPDPQCCRAESCRCDIRNRANRSRLIDLLWKLDQRETTAATIVLVDFPHGMTSRSAPGKEIQDDSIRVLAC